MAFTPEDRNALAEARETCQRLGRLEAMAVNDVSRVLYDAGLDLREHRSWAEVCDHAAAIRDALAPFDDGVRELHHEDLPS